MSLIQIEVTLDAETNQLIPDQPEIDLNPGDEVQWVFLTPHPSHLPHIFFPTGESHNNQQFGPFQYIERSSSGLLARGNTGFAGSYPYVLTLLNETDPVATSAQVNITNLATTPDTSPDAIVQFEPAAAPGSKPTLRVTPNSLSVETMRTATWHIKGIPADHFVTFRFDDERVLTGPFASFSLSRGSGDCWRATGTNLLFDHESGPLPSAIGYFVSLRDADGHEVTTSDPVIEPLGTPPGPPTE